MKAFALYLFIVVASHAASIAFDAGASYVAATGAKYETNPDPAIRSEDKGAWSPYFGASIGIAQRIALRLGYQFVNGLDTKAVYPFPPGPGNVKFQVVTPREYRSDIHIFGLGPQFGFQLSQSFSAVVSPELNWVIERGEVRDEGNYLRDRNLDKPTFGAFVSLRQKLTDRWSVEAGYRYVDADPSWSRKFNCFLIGFGFR